MVSELEEAAREGPQPQATHPVARTTDRYHKAVPPALLAAGATGAHRGTLTSALEVRDGSLGKWIYTETPSFYHFEPSCKHSRKERQILSRESKLLHEILWGRLTQLMILHVLFNHRI